jgi:hypothetical protein
VRNEDIGERLRTADPVAREPGLSTTEVQVMRRAIVAAGGDTRHAGWSPWRLALAGTLVFAVVLAVFIGTVLAPVTPVSTQPPATEQRQLQFETPGGTRVVWVLNSQFDLPKDRQP